MYEAKQYCRDTLKRLQKEKTFKILKKSELEKELVLKKDEKLV